MDRAEPLGEKLSMAAMASEDVVIRTEQEGLSHSGCLLADREMGGALVVVFESLVAAHFLDLVKHRLELTDDGHVPVDQERLTCVEGSAGNLIGEGSTVGVCRYLPELGRSRATHFVGIHYQVLDHLELCLFLLGASVTK